MTKKREEYRFTTYKEAQSFWLAMREIGNKCVAPNWDGERWIVEAVV